MSHTSNEAGEERAAGPRRDDQAERQEIADFQARLDAESDGDGLAAEAGAGEETGLAEG